MAVTVAPALVVLREEEVLKRLTPALALAAVEEALIAVASGSGSLDPVLIARGLNEGEVFGVKAGRARKDAIVGLKVGSYWPRNDELGLAPHGSSILLLDPKTGRLA